MSNSPEIFEEDAARNDHKPEERPVLSPLQEISLADGHRWASLDVVDLDPPTWFPPN